MTRLTGQTRELRRSIAQLFQQQN